MSLEQEKKKLMEVASSLRDTAESMEEDEGFCQPVINLQWIAEEVDEIVQKLEEL